MPFLKSVRTLIDIQRFPNTKCPRICRHNVKWQRYHIMFTSSYTTSWQYKLLAGNYTISFIITFNHDRYNIIWIIWHLIFNLRLFVQFFDEIYFYCFFNYFNVSGEKLRDAVNYILFRVITWFNLWTHSFHYTFSFSFSFFPLSISWNSLFGFLLWNVYEMFIQIVLLALNYRCNSFSITLAIGPTP